MADIKVGIRDNVDSTHSLSDHLTELRKRLVNIVICVAVLFVVAYSQGGYLMQALLAPINQYMPAGSTMSFSNLTEGFMTELKLAAIVAFILSMPFILYQLWMFVAPGLYAHERRYVFSFVFFASVLFFVGCSFAYFVVFPFGFQFFLKYANPDWHMAAILSVGTYLSFVMQLLIAFGLVFETPVIIFFLVKIGLVNAKMLIKSRKYAIVGIFILAAVLTPPDVISQTAMAIPLIILYQISIFIAKIFGKKEEETSQEVAIYEW